MLAERPRMAGRLRRTSAYLTHPVFNTHHTETEMLRYIRKLESRDLSLCTSMIPLGSCTMKLNATAEMLSRLVAHGRQAASLRADRPDARLPDAVPQLEAWLAEITGMAAVSLQPNAGSQGEYAGLLAIRAYHAARGEEGAHLPHPGLRARDQSGQRGHGGHEGRAGGLRRQRQHRHRRPAREGETSTSGRSRLRDDHLSLHARRLRGGIVEAAEIIHAHGGQVYMDGANMTAQVGLCRPGDFGMDVCHLNLHKTFCIPHGGGGPGRRADRGRGASGADYLPGTR
jgi:glycine dehydrogenase